MSAVVEQPGIGHNLPPTEQEQLRSYLIDNNLDLRERQEQLLAGATRAPETIDDEETAGKMGDFIKQLTAFDKTCETKRVGTKEPYLSAERTVDGFFKGLAKPITDAKTRLHARLTDYLRRKEAAERLRRENEARAAQAEADRLAAEARKAAEVAQAEADRLAAEKRLAELADTELSAESTKTTDAAADQATAAMRLAAQASADAAEAEKAATAKASDLSRTRGDFGAVAGLQTFWDHKDLDRSNLDLETLRPFLPMDALEQSVRGYIKLNKEALDRGQAQIKGVVIFKNTRAAVR